MNSIKVAVVGTGFMGWVHIEALRRLGIGISGVLGSSPEKTKAFALKTGITKAYASYEEVLADPDAGSVHLGVPNKFHFLMAKQALEAGKHVLCEKPLAMNTAESAALVAIAAKYPKQAAGVNYNIRYYPLCIEAKDRIRKKELGDIFHITGSYSQDWLLHDTDYNWRVLDSEGGELRAVSDIGTHWLDLIYFITGLEVESVCADLQTVHPVRKRPKGEIATFQGKGQTFVDTENIPITTDDYGSILLRFKGGKKGLLWVSQVSAGHKNCLRFEIAGSKQAVNWNSEKPNEIMFGNRDRANEILLRDPSLLGSDARKFADYPGGHDEGYDDSFKMCFRGFYDAIASGKTSVQAQYPTFADGHREIVLCEAILQSHREQRWIKVKE